MKWFKYLFVGLSIFIGVLVLGIVVGLAAFSGHLPSMDALKNYQPLLVTRLFADDDTVFADYSTERRITIAATELPKVLVQAFVAAEDDEFFSHRGVNPVSILRAFLKDIQAGHKVQGGSTITQQVAKQILLTSEKSLTRKIKELLLAFKIEKALSKDEILSLYLNQIFLGEGAYGVESASQTYFGKHAKDITLPEAAILAGLPRAPSRDNPIQNPKAAKQKQLYVLGRMLAVHAIGPAEHDEAMHAPVQIKSRTTSLDNPAPYYSEHVRRYLVQKYGSDALYGGGLRVYTTMNLKAQLAAQDAIKTGLLALDKRVGLRKPSKYLKNTADRESFLKAQHKSLIEEFYDYQLLTPEGALVSAINLDDPTPIVPNKDYQALVLEKERKTRSIIIGIGNQKGIIKPVDYQWANQANPEELYTEKVIRSPYEQLNIGEVITVVSKATKNTVTKETREEFSLGQQPLVQGALVSYNIPDGALKSLVGGYDFRVTKSEFNRAIQAQRQPGSSFKPIVYAAALDNGLTPSTIIVDSPIVYRDNDEKTQVEKTWKPDNSTDKFYGDTTLRNALAFSRNVPTIKLLQYLKIPTVIEYAKKLGIKSTLANDLTLAIGSSAVSLDEIAKAEATFANHGKKVHTFFIRRIEDRNGAILEEHQQEPDEELIPEATAFLITSMMRSVVDIGTGTVAQGLKRPVAGKTGTTNDFKDAWFLGFIPQIFTGVWVGFDEDRPLGKNETGGYAAAPIWLQYMKTAAADLPVEDFDPPKSVVQVQVDSETGDLPSAKTKKRYSEYFAEGSAPGQTAPAPTPSPGAQNPAPTNVAGNSQVNRTKVITGNPDRPTLEGAPSNSGDADVGADELYRNEL